jgi:hypothetical protein
MSWCLRRYLSTSRHLRRYFKYLLVSGRVLSVPPGVSGGTFSTSWGVLVLGFRVGL